MSVNRAVVSLPKIAPRVIAMGNMKWKILKSCRGVQLWEGTDEDEDVTGGRDGEAPHSSHRHCYGITVDGRVIDPIPDNYEQALRLYYEILGGRGGPDRGPMTMEL